jgi:hypothetical protein
MMIILLSRMYEFEVFPYDVEAVISLISENN